MTCSSAPCFGKSDVAIEVCERIVRESKFEPIFIFL